MLAGIDPGSDAARISDRVGRAGIDREGSRRLHWASARRSPMNTNQHRLPWSRCARWPRSFRCSPERRSARRTATTTANPPRRSMSGRATRPASPQTSLPSSTSTKTRPATARSSGRFPFRDRAAPETSRTTAISPPTRTSWRVAACWPCCGVRTASSSLMCRTPRRPRFLFSTSGTLSNITDDFLPLKDGGFLVTQMGSHTGGTPGRVAEFDADLQLVGEWPANPPEHDFNPHGISARPDLNLMVTSDFMMPASSLNVVPGDPLLRGIIRVWDLQQPIDRPHDRDPERARDHGRQADPQRSAGPRIHGGNVRRPRVPRGHRERHGAASSSTARPSCLTSRFLFAEG